MTSYRIVLVLTMFLGIMFVGKVGYSKTKAQAIAEIDREVKRINRLVLKKTKKSVGDPDKVFEEAIIYFDDKNRIRKVILLWDGLDAYGESIMYFRTNGSLCYTSFADKSDGENLHNLFCGTVYFYNKKAIKMDTQYYNTFNRKVIRRNIKNVYSYNSSLPHQTVEELMKALRDYKKSLFDAKFTFRVPKKGETSINTNNVVLRKKPNTKSKVLFKLNYSEVISILSIGKQQAIGRWGKHRWYKIAYFDYDFKADKEKKIIGWVFGAFLEPVEVKVR